MKTYSNIGRPKHSLNSKTIILGIKTNEDQYDCINDNRSRLKLIILDKIEAFKRLYPDRVVPKNIEYLIDELNREKEINK